jgi:hypothetical protein
MNKLSSLFAIALLLLTTATAKSQTIKPSARAHSLSVPSQDPCNSSSVFEGWSTRRHRQASDWEWSVNHTSIHW